jgi:hypothetical protein
MKRAILLLPVAFWAARLTGLATDQPTDPLEFDFDTLRNPTVLNSSASLDGEYLDRDADGFRWKFNLAGALAFGPPGAKDWIVSAELPYVYEETGSGEKHASGVGDFRLAAGHLVDGLGRFRWGVGLATTFDTASDVLLGDGVVKLAPQLGVGYRVTENFELVGNLQYNRSVREAGGRTQVNSLELNPALIKAWPANWFTVLGYDNAWNFEAGNQYSSKVKLDLGKAMGSQHQWIASVGVDLPVANRGANNLTVKAGLSHIFN